MKTLSHTTLAILLTALCAGAGAGAAELTRAEVIAQLHEARRNGDIVVGESSQTLRERFPQLYPAARPGVAVSREQVITELESARRNGDLAHPITGERLNERYPQLYPRQPQSMAKTRGQVQAELAEARRTGDLEIGESGLKLYELFPERYATARAQQEARSGTAPAGL
jgi:Domain of unknown function (DUF4148)